MRLESQDSRVQGPQASRRIGVFLPDAVESHLGEGRLLGGVRERYQSYILERSEWLRGRDWMRGRGGCG